MTIHLLFRNSRPQSILGHLTITYTTASTILFLLLQNSISHKSIQCWRNGKSDWSLFNNSIANTSPRSPISSLPEALFEIT